ncbi:SpoIIE family protein phosphatase [Streptomyces sp. NPDC001406]|uniref:SpoIIE family protein phosphatase n=1 Tax=Streptomyces sp. NPDC001406 TaxID=3364572 RepID=UPI0036A08AB9
MTLANAGHVPPLLRHTPRRARILDFEPGPLLGIDTHARYPLTAAPLPRGSLVALHTDGLIDGLVPCAWPTGQCTDDVTVFLLRSKGQSSVPS